MKGGIRRETIALRIGERDVSVRLESEVMAILAGIAADEGLSVEDLVRRVDAAREGGQASLVSALRAFVLAYHLPIEA
jgi:predicted DNA-binding ribbon-helix-helix protein